MHFVSKVFLVYSEIFQLPVRHMEPTASLLKHQLLNRHLTVIER